MMAGKCGGDIAVMNRHGGGKAAQSGILLKIQLLLLLKFATH